MAHSMKKNGSENVLIAQIHMLPIFNVITRIRVFQNSKIIGYSNGTFHRIKVFVVTNRSQILRYNSVFCHLYNYFKQFAPVTSTRFNDGK